MASCYNSPFSHQRKLLMNYKQLTSEERYQIYALMKAGLTQKKIATLINRCASTISREVKRNKGLKGYRSKQAHEFSKVRAKKAYKYRKITPLVTSWIIELLQRDFTPEQIAGRLAMEKNISLHHETIYRLIYRDKADGGVLYKCLPRASKRYRKRYGSYKPIIQIRQTNNRIWITYNSVYFCVLLR
ncbi:hypothetical protein CJF42_20695 [Pseudoalteromonas sp. NBT06-2]|nr:hypothetical protein CJF42_20695 [Pseudoalteromonas sp. NBT06-2]